MAGFFKKFNFVAFRRELKADEVRRRDELRALRQANIDMYLAELAALDQQIEDIEAREAERRVLRKALRAALTAEIDELQRALDRSRS